MHLSVRARIALVISMMLVVNVAIASVARIAESRAAASEADALRARARSSAALSASKDVTAFLGDATGMGFAVREGRAPEEVSGTYGALRGSDRLVDTSLSRLEATLPETRAAELRGQWAALRLTVFGWVNAEAAAGGSSTRLALARDGGVQASVTTTLGLPPDLAALGDSALRDRVRSLGEALSAGTLRVIANDADTEARLATDRAVQTRESAWKVTVWAIALGALVTLAASAWLYRTIAVPLGRARRYAEEVAAGRADAGLPRHTADEIGALTRAVEAMKEALAGRVAVMREMAGVVIFQAEGVGVAARHALGVQEHADANGAGADLEDMHEVVRRAETLRDLAEQMLQA